MLADLAGVACVVLVLLGDHVRLVVGRAVLLAGVAHVAAILHRGRNAAAAGPCT